MLFKAHLSNYQLRLAQISCRVLWMENLSHCLILQLILQAQKVLTLEFFAFKMPSRFSNSSHKQRTVCFPIVRTEKCRFSWATILLVFTELIIVQILFFAIFICCCAVTSLVPAMRAAWNVLWFCACCWKKFSFYPMCNDKINR